MDLMARILELAQSGAGNLAAYLAAHVLLCLLPAFFIAGGLSALVPREAVTRFLGRNAPKIVSYPAAAVGGFVLAVCSCTIMPLFAGIYKRGAGLGPAITFLFVGPAINVLALAYTGVALGMDIAIARLILSILFGIGIGLIMALIFRADDQARAEENDGAFGRRVRLERRTWVFMLLLLSLLIVGTLQVGLFTGSVAQVTLPIEGAARFQGTLDRLVPHDPSLGEEGVTVQGVILIGLLTLIAVSAWFGLNRVDEGFNRWTWIALGLTAATLMVAATQIEPNASGLVVRLTGRMVAVALSLAAIGLVAIKSFDAFEVQEWLWETWRFVKQIFPLLIVGVFAVGAIRGLIKPEWIQALAGRNSVFASFVGVVFGVFMYFPTLVEVPIANMFLSLGMHRGPLLAYLMSDPELSLQSILITSSVIGKGKTWVYVGWVAVFSTLAGLTYGAWVDGASVWMLALYLVIGLGLLAMTLAWISRRQSVKVKRQAVVSAD